MAWFLERDAIPYAVVKFDMEPSCEEIEPSLEYFVENGIRHLYGRLTRSAVDIPDRFWPKRARLKSARKSMPDLIGLCSFWGVSQAFRDCVEEIEPGVHEFKPVEVLHKDGTPFRETYHAINIKKIIQGAVNFIDTDIPSKEFHQGWQLAGLANFESRRIFLKGGSVSGLHLWISNDVVGRVIAVSDTLYDDLKSKNLLTGVIPFKAIERQG